MAIIPTQQDIDMLQQNIKDIRVRVDLLNFNFQTVDNIEGNLLDGNINIDANQDIRRVASISLVVTDSSFNIAQGAKIWIDKYIKVYVGHTDILTGEFVWWNLGIFMINNPSKVYDARTNTLTFDGQDLMAKLTGKRNGQLEAITTIIPAGTPIDEAVIASLQLGGFTKYVVQSTTNTVPYDIKVPSDGFIYNILAELRDLYSNWEMFFDVDGIFYFREIPTGLNSPIVLDFTQLNQQITITDNSNVNFENVKNKIIVWGRLLDDGTQITAEFSDTYENSPYNIDTIGEILYIVPDERIYTNDLALQRAKYELFLHSNMNNSITINTMPIYWLNDVNVCIKIRNVDTQEIEVYMIKSSTIPLGINSTMTINAIKVYEDENAYT